MKKLMLATLAALCLTTPALAGQVTLLIPVEIPGANTTADNVIAPAGSTCDVISYNRDGDRAYFGLMCDVYRQGPYPETVRRVITAWADQVKAK